ncbi:hypothetical protein ACIQU4_18525 [Streptomyces sp. NPDC090741]|uniref:hypothetical protein n=1 Tax=Streptomyces sp. NPDC090741 TaxID=3365967 RepID=UPI00382752BF
MGGAGPLDAATCAVMREGPQLVIPKKAASGSSTADLLAYPFGPGERDEHVAPHLVGGWDPDLPFPARDLGRMALAEPVAATLVAAGIAGHGDDQACRWIAARHGDVGPAGRPTPARAR